MNAESLLNAGTRMCLCWESKLYSWPCTYRRIYTSLENSMAAAPTIYLKDIVNVLMQTDLHR